MSSTKDKIFEKKKGMHLILYSEWWYRRHNEHTTSADIKVEKLCRILLLTSTTGPVLLHSDACKDSFFLSFLAWRTLVEFCNVKYDISDKIFLVSAFKLSRVLSVQSRLSFLSRHYITTNFVFHIYQRVTARK